MHNTLAVPMELAFWAVIGGGVGLLIRSRFGRYNDILIGVCGAEVGGMLFAWFWISLTDQALSDGGILANLYAAFAAFFVSTHCMFAVARLFRTEEEKRQDRERDESACIFTSKGDTVNVRTYSTKSGDVTEVETTRAVIVVEGRIASIDKGTPVFSNEDGEVRFRSRTSDQTFHICR